MLIEIDGRSVLLDTGQTDLIFHNARALGVDLSQVDSIVLSHGHYDHTGGLCHLLEALPRKPQVFAHPDVFLNRYGCYEEGMRYLDPPCPKEQIERSGAILRLSEGAQEIAPGLKTTGEVPRKTKYEDVGGPYYLDLDCEIPDPLRDDEALVIDVPEGLIVCCGCAHSGVVNTLLHVQTLYPGKSVYTVIGGLHLRRATEERLDSTISALTQMGLKRIIAGHCTGPLGLARMATEMPDSFRPLFVGVRHRFGA